MCPSVCNDVYDCQSQVTWSDTSRAEQMLLVAMAMSYMHLSAEEAVDKLYSHQQLCQRFITSATFEEFVHAFTVLSAHIAKTGKVFNCTLNATVKFYFATISVEKWRS